MLETIIIVGLVVLLVVSEFNPVAAVRKLWAAVSFGIGATPKGIETSKAKIEEWTAQAKEQEAREGKVFERVGSSFRHKGKVWAEEELDPVIKASREAKTKSDEVLAKLLAK